MPNPTTLLPHVPHALVVGLGRAAGPGIDAAGIGTGASVADLARVVFGTPHAAETVAHSGGAQSVKELAVLAGHRAAHADGALLTRT